MLRIGDRLRFDATGEIVKVVEIQIMVSDGSAHVLLDTMKIPIAWKSIAGNVTIIKLS